MLNAVLITGGILIVAVLLLKYLNGDFSYIDSIYSEQKYTRTRENLMGWERVDSVKRIVIKRHYGNGRIKFITKEVEI